MKDCIFCDLIAGRIPASLVYEDELTFAFMDIGQVNPGHVLIATKRHAPDIWSVSGEEAAAAMDTASRIARAVQAAFSPPGLMLLQTNGAAGDQTVFHFHLHLLPRHDNDGVVLSWPRKHPSREMLEHHAGKLRIALSGG